jgi:2-deoxy-D-gluconate 3-dehydrogenase
MTPKLTGTVAVVTGASSGIGEATARRLAEDGASVVLVARRRDRLEALAAEIERAGGSALAVQADITDRTQAEAAVQQSVERFGRLDILVNNAGMNIRKPPQEYTLVEWRSVLDTNLTSVFLCSRAAYPVMKAAGGGKIINIGSMMSIFGASFAAAYAASKGGIVQLTKALASAWARDNIQVNAVLPGWIDTELTRNARRQVEGLHESVLRRTPAGRWGGMDDMAGVAVFLAAPASDFVTGTAIPVDGGYAIQG